MLSILSQLLQGGGADEAAPRPDPDFQFFPSCCKRNCLPRSYPVHQLSILSQLLPLARAAPELCGPGPLRLSILSQLLPTKLLTSHGKVLQEAFNSFPVAA